MRVPFLLRCTFSFEQPCPETRFLTRDATILYVSKLGSVGVPFLVGMVDIERLETADPSMGVSSL